MRPNDKLLNAREKYIEGRIAFKAERPGAGFVEEGERA